MSPEQTHATGHGALPTTAGGETPEEIAKHDPNSLYSFCKDCPPNVHCCFRAMTIVVLPKEAEKIIARTGRSDLLRQEEHGLFTIKKEKNRGCPFLTPNRLCSIYDIRPTDCRSWPLTMDQKANPRGTYLVDVKCPAAESAHLEKKFCDAARKSLNAIPVTLRRTFVNLVYRDFDVLPMKPYTNGNQKPKDKEMNDKEPPKTSKLSSSWREFWHNPATVLVGVLLVCPLFLLFEHDSGRTFSENKWAYCWAVGSLALVAVFSLTISQRCFKSAFSKKTREDDSATEAKWQKALLELGEILKETTDYSIQMRQEIEAARSEADAKIHQEFKAIADRKAYLEREKHEFDLFTNTRQNYYVNEAAIADIEAMTDDLITVVVRNFDHEEKSEYEKVIVQNISKPESPSYQYFVLKGGVTAATVQALRTRLEKKLVESKMPPDEAKKRVHSRLKFYLLESKDFPHCAGYGLVIYRFRDVNKNRCFSYWPKELGNCNVDIYKAGNEEGHRIMDDIIDQLDARSKDPKSRPT
jgi:Fe-S-cluster containining protein